MLLLGHVMERIEEFAQQTHDVHLLQSQAHHVVLHSTEFQQLVDQMHQSVRIVLQQRHGLLQGVGQLTTLANALQCATYQRKRRSEFVAHIGEKHQLGLIQLLLHTDMLTQAHTITYLAVGKPRSTRQEQGPKTDGPSAQIPWPCNVERDVYRIAPTPGLIDSTHQKRIMPGAEMFKIKSADGR